MCGRAPEAVLPSPANKGKQAIEQLSLAPDNELLDAAKMTRVHGGLRGRHAVRGGLRFSLFISFFFYSLVSITVTLLVSITVTLLQYYLFLSYRSVRMGLPFCPFSLGDHLILLRYTR